ncbi:acyltransferase family protein, partial [Enterobacter roggenkampii]|uniref:acyltransferase family protein n=1 Tax=Enterobacter roggenkampii TaxID=1812935 RepID=UPI003A5B7DAB
IGPDPRNFNQRVSLGRNDLLIRTFPSFLSLSIVWGCLILLAVRDCGIYSNFFSSSAMRNIGNKSFSIYLFHWFFLTEMSKLYPNNALAMAASILMSTLAGWLIFALIEKPIENYRHRLQKSLIR